MDKAAKLFGGIMLTAVGFAALTVLGTFFGWLFGWWLAHHIAFH